MPDPYVFQILSIMEMFIVVGFIGLVLSHSDIIDFIAVIIITIGSLLVAVMGGGWLMLLPPIIGLAIFVHDRVDEQHMRFAHWAREGRRLKRFLTNPRLDDDAHG